MENFLYIFGVICIMVFSVILYRKNQIEDYTYDVTLLRKYIAECYRKLAEMNPKPKIPYPVYYINMDKDKDRKKYIEGQKKYVDMELTRVAGFNGKKIQNLTEDTVDGITFTNGYPSLTRSEIGCAISHIRAIQIAWGNGDEIAVICEDDISFCTMCMIPSLSNIVKNCPGNWELLQLAGLMKDLPGKNVRYISRNEHPFYGFSIYLINRKGMRKILDRVVIDGIYTLEPVSGLPEYGMADSYIPDLVTTYAISPPMFIVNNIDLDSTIHTDHTDIHLESSMNILKNLIILYGNK